MRSRTVAHIIIIIIIKKEERTKHLLLLHPSSPTTHHYHHHSILDCFGLRPFGLSPLTIDLKPSAIAVEKKKRKISASSPPIALPQRTNVLIMTKAIKYCTICATHLTGPQSLWSGSLTVPADRMNSEARDCLLIGCCWSAMVIAFFVISSLFR